MTTQPGSHAARTMIETIERFYSSALCAFLGLFGLLLLTWPLSRRLGAPPGTWRRAWFMYPLGLASLGAAALFQRWSSAHLGATLIIAAVVAVGLAIGVLLDRRRSH